ncbi:MAG: ParA family protein, partial [bacterium]|nr:ParA family protein [bacterium]
TIGLFNEKGGVGKSTIATHIAAGLALRGATVVLIDTDPQGNATSALGHEKVPDFYDLTVRNKPWKDVLKLVLPELYEPPNEPSSGKLFLCGGNKESRNIANSISNPAVVRRRIKELEGVVDFVIFDTSPTPSLLHAALTSASDYVIIPTDLQEFGALQGVPATLEHVMEIRNEAMARGLNIAKPLAILPNKYQKAIKVQQDILESVKSTYGDMVWEEIPLLTAFSEAQVTSRLLYAYAPKSKAATYMWQLIDHIMEEVYAS